VSFRGLILGNIFEQRSLHDIVKSSKELQYLRSLRISDIKECSNCKYVKACHFCVGINYSLNGTCLSCSMQHCNYIKAAVSFFGL
jgi:radical SAM protein with 4Fe4S-binding SPASM domain